MRLAVSGTHRVGKTTLAHALADRLPDHELVDEPYHELVSEGHSFSHPPGIEDFEEQLTRSLSTLEEGQENVIFDRSPVDFLAYLVAAGGDEAAVLEEWGEPVAEAMRSLDVVILVPVEEPDLVETGPDLDPAGDREAVDGIIRDLLLNDRLDLETEVVEVRGTPEARAAAVLSRLGLPRDSRR